LERKFLANVDTRFPPVRVSAIYDLFSDQQRLEEIPVNQLMDLLVV
jgi:2-methylcitrate dehydratase